MRLKILIADDQPVLRAGIASLLPKQIPGECTVGEITIGPGVIEATAALKPELIIMELGPHGGSGLAVLESLKRQFPKTPVIVFTVHAEEFFALRCLKVGAAGFLRKSASFRRSNRKQQPNDDDSQRLQQNGLRPRHRLVGCKCRSG